MTTPTVTELPRRLEPVCKDPFADGSGDRARQATSFKLRGLAAVVLGSAMLAIPASPAVAKDCAYVCTADGDGGYTCQRICQ